MKNTSETVRLVNGALVGDSRILDLARRLAGDKWTRVFEITVELSGQGKSTGRALADALETLKLN